MWLRSPVTGSSPKSTPPTRAATCRCTRTAIGAGGPAPTGRREEPSTSRTAASNAAQPTTSRQDWNCPAMDEAPTSSTVDDDRTTRGVSGAATASHAARSCSSASGGRLVPNHPGAAGSKEAVVRTNPGMIGRPAAPAIARFAAFAPVSRASVARGSVSDRTSGSSGSARPGRARGCDVRSGCVRAGRDPTGAGEVLRPVCTLSLYAGWSWADRPSDRPMDWVLGP